MANEENQSPVDRYPNVVESLRDAIDLWPRILHRVQAARTPGGNFEAERPQVDRLFQAYEEAMRAVARQAEEHSRFRPGDAFYPWLEDQVLRHAIRPYHRIGEPQWYVKEIERGIRDLEESLRGAGLSNGERQRLIAALTQAANAMSEILAGLMRPSGAPPERSRP